MIKRQNVRLTCLEESETNTIELKGEDEHAVAAMT